MKKIWVLYTGGTIGMVQGKKGLHPNTAIVHHALAPFSGSMMFDWYVCSPLIDSSAVTPQNWRTWLELLRTNLPHYDGVLILHGTDTMAYTANVLALALDTCSKPVILTGAQKPFDVPNSDAHANLRTAVSALQHDDIHEVLLAFHGKLFPAVGSSKISTERDDGFANMHFGTWLPETVALPFSGSLKRDFDERMRVLSLFLTPAHGTQLAAQILRTSDADAVVLQSFGHGNAPDDTDLLAAIDVFVSQGKIVLNISQVAQGYAADVYEQGNALRQSDIINAGKCNIETATALLLLAAANRWTRDEVYSELRRLRLL